MKALNKLNKLPISINPKALMFIFVALCTVGSFPAAGISFSDFYRDSIAEIGFIGLLLYIAYQNRALNQITLKLNTTRLLFAALFLYAGISIFWSSQVGFFISEYILWMAAAAVFLLSSGLAADAKNRIIIARFLVFTSCYISSIALIQSIFSVDIFSQAVAPAATFVNKNMAAQVIVLVFPLSLFLLFTDKNKNLAVLYPYIIALMLAHVFHSRTRAIWLSMALELLLIAVVMIIYRKQIALAIKEQILYWREKQIVHIILAVILLLFLISVFNNHFVFFSDIFQARINSIATYANDEGNVRYLVWDAAVIMVAHNPFFGTGMGSFYYNMVDQVSEYQQFNLLRAHNDLLEVAVELGIVGLSLLLAVISALVHNLFKLIKQGDIQQQLFYFGLGIAFFGSALNMQFSFPYQMAVPLMIFGLYTGLIVKANDALITNMKTFTFSISSKYRYAISALVGGIFVAVVIINITWLESFNIINNNLRTNKWKNPTISQPFSCHKDIAHIVYEMTRIYSESKRYKGSLAVLDSFNQCVPDTWQYNASKGIVLINLKRYDQALKVLEKAKKTAPQGFYENHINQIVIYRKIGNHKQALKAYQQLSAEPKELLVLKPITLKFLTEIAVNAKQIKKALEFYKLYNQHHRKSKSLDAIIKPHLK